MPKTALSPHCMAQTPFHPSACAGGSFVRRPVLCLVRPVHAHDPRAGREPIGLPGHVTRTLPGHIPCAQPRTNAGTLSGNIDACERRGSRRRGPRTGACMSILLGFTLLRPKWVLWFQPDPECELNAAGHPVPHVHVIRDGDGVCPGGCTPPSQRFPRRGGRDRCREGAGQ